MKRQRREKDDKIKQNARANKSIYIGTYNVRSLLGEDRLVELQEELQHIKWDIIGLAETRRRGENIEQLKNGSVLYTVGKENRSDSGVGFLVNQQLANNVVEFKSTSDRVAMIVIKLSHRYMLKVIQVYAPTSAHDDDEIEDMYEEINHLMDYSKTHYTMVIGDFNAKIGKQKDTEASVMGKYGTGIRNERGDRLIEFARSRNLYIANGKFQRKEKNLWTWKSPDGATRNQIDFIMTNQRDTIMNISVINRVNTGSDHRLLRSKVKFNTKIERLKLASRSKPAINYDVLHTKSEAFQLELSNRFNALVIDSDNIDRYNQETIQIVRDAATTIAGCKRRTNKHDKISDQTKAMLKKRREMKIDLTKWSKIEYVELCKTIRKRMREEIRRYNVALVERALLENKGLKSSKQKIANGRKLMVAVKAENGSIITDRTKIAERCAEFYSKLYSSTMPRPDIPATPNDDIPEILYSEVEHAARYMKCNKAPGEDEIVIEIIKEGGSVMSRHLARLFTSCLRSRKVPKSWNNAIIILLHKKGDIKDINNYRPISLVSHVSKLFSKVILNRIERALDNNQPREQAGFRSGYSTTDHLHTINQVVEKCNEFRIPLCLAFVDYEKAFDSVEHVGIMEAMDNQGVNKGYIELLANIYNNATSMIRLDKDSVKFEVKRGVRQGDTISPKLFNAGLEQVFRRLDWDTKGIMVNGERINHLRFADDIVLISNNVTDITEMLNQLSAESKTLGLKINMKKTKVMFNDYINTINDVRIENDTVEAVDGYVYLGQLVTTKGDKIDEIKRRIAAAWGAFGKYRDIMKSNIPMCLKRKVYNQCVQAAMTYGCQTWALTKRMQEKLQTTQRSMERAMIGITRRDRKTNIWIRQQTGIKDIVVRIKELKWQWAGHVARANNNKWTKIVTEWTPREEKRKQARPKIRWCDEIVKSAGAVWMRKARNRNEWKHQGEAFIQQWI